MTKNLKFKTRKTKVKSMTASNPQQTRSGLEPNCPKCGEKL